jgi:hypothetical protein
VRRLVTTAIIVAMATPAYAQLSPGSGAPATGAPATGSPGAASPQGGRPSITLGGEKKAMGKHPRRGDVPVHCQPEAARFAVIRTPKARPSSPMTPCCRAHDAWDGVGFRLRPPCEKQPLFRAETIENVGGPYALKALMLSRRTWAPGEAHPNIC